MIDRLTDDLVIPIDVISIYWETLRWFAFWMFLLKCEMKM